MNHRHLIAFLFLLAPVITRAADDQPAQKPIRVLVWDEQQPDQKKAYGEQFLGQTIAAHLAKNPALKVTTAAQPSKEKSSDPDPALTPEALDQLDVIVWWGHIRQREVKWEQADQIVDRIKSNKLALITLHSAHWSSPFIRAMNAKTIEQALKTLPEEKRATARLNLNYPKYSPVKHETPLTPSVKQTTSPDGQITLDINLPICVFPDWRHDDKPGHLTTLLPDHPIAKGLPEKWDVTKTEMYNEPFHVPTPDQVIFEEKWDAGEHFRSGMLWNIGQGKLFYFRPGHETCPVYKEEFPLKVIENATLWLGTQIKK